LISSPLQQNAISGAATWTPADHIAVNKVGAYTLHATDGTRSVDAPAPFNVSNAPASQLVFTTAQTPANVFSDLTLTVQAQDPFGNLDTGYSGQVDLSINNFVGAGGPPNLSGTTTLSTSGGVFAFLGNHVQVDTVGDYTFLAKDHNNVLSSGT